ncbi:MAG: hypothetical protein HFI93_10510 [Lachnospiraceae bacterium]|nr:hypothetical protein [Lachnospiraceae bacterium]
MHEYRKRISEVLDDLETPLQGLSQAEADRRLAEYGPNKLAEEQPPSFLRRFLTQLKNPMLLILLAAALVSGVTAFFAGETFTDVIIILLVVFLNGLLGMIQEQKAEQAVRALQDMTAPACTVIRNGRKLSLPREKPVPVDLLILEAGNTVPDAFLTAEPPLGDRVNMLYMGSTLVYGRGQALVTQTGMQTEMGKIAEALSCAQKEATPLQKKPNELSRLLSLAVIGICLVRDGILDGNLPRL